jgi:hypothetical protein
LNVAYSGRCGGAVQAGSLCGKPLLGRSL